MVAFSSIVLAVSAIAGSAFAAPTADVPDFEFNGPNKAVALAARQDYNQNYRTSGNVNFQPKNNGYSVNFSNADDFVVGKGWSKGTTRAIKFSGSTQPQSGTVLVSVYGWSTSPLVEYYIQEYTSNGSGSAQGTKVGSVTCDGSVYDIWKHTQVNQDSIQGKATFPQYISNRRDKRPGSGTVTTKCHFDAWAKYGMNLGTMNYQVLATEGWGKAGGNSAYTISSA
ncbi:glycoside hydrolase family 11 [Pyrenophora seminiperda CCB06]|uniref:Endo-1,4-beta-xylanase n=1 Tax=Pyrenophora seminiperda CCB06 TaxID=1302712 RepID=A0A3M7MF36_9PLEO|nr:glycoside hydrolase family 11 [Pyrenophora seminiperda CCB06]